MTPRIVIHLPADTSLDLLALLAGDNDPAMRAAARRILRAHGYKALPALRAARDNARGRSRRWIKAFYDRLVNEILARVRR